MAVKQRRSVSSGRDLPQDLALKFLDAERGLQEAKDEYHNTKIKVLGWALQENRTDMFTLNMRKVRVMAWDHQSSREKF